MDRSVGILDRPIVDSAAHDGASARLADRRGRRSPSGTGRAAHEQRLIRIGLLLPISGSSGMHGPPGRSCAQLAVEEINALGGLLGRRVQVVVADGGMSFAASAREGERLIEEDGVAAVIGTHPSGVREILGPKIGRRVPYVYTPIFEGDGYEPGVFYLGETAYQQLGPVLPWMKAHLGIRRWYLIGNDFRWPRDVHRMARRLLAEQQGVLAGDRLVPLETEDFDAIVAEIRALRPDALIVTLVGSDAVIFHRAFTRAGLDDRIWRLGLLTEENTVLGMGFRWPRDVHRMARRLLAEQQGVLAGDRLVPLETEDFDAIVAEIRALRPDALIVTLVGSDAVIFHRAFTRAGLDDRIWRLGLLTEENTVLGMEIAPNAAVGCCRARPILRACPTPRTRTSCNATGAASVRTRRC